MIKKTIFILICFIILFSCGRKGDPEYQSNQYKIIMHKV